ncbi:MAG TPA: phosphate signaling complex protein PhoU [Candidatus Omnitrophica bacterium]|nr:phosphate signaling complex protein PhoU [Candidatus Omnitrophota bacterium]
MINDKIIELKQRLTEFATHIEKMIERGIDGLSKRDVGIFSKILEADESRANSMEIEIDELCTLLIAQFHPKAVALRTVLMIMKMNNDLERMGDHAVNICISGISLIEYPPVKELIDIPRMADEVKKMLKDSIDSYLNQDINLARDVCYRDGKIDGLRDRIIRELIACMTKDGSVISPALQLMNITRNLERIADLTTNICEDVIFMVEGKVIKHHMEDK